MLDEEQVLEFLNMIINTPGISKEEIKKGISFFRNSFILNNMCDADFQNKMSRILSCLDAIIMIKETFGYVNLPALLLEPEMHKQKIKSNRNRQRYTSRC